MFKLRKDKHESEILFCERCGSVCDPTCFAEQSRDRGFEELLRHGRWVA